MTEGDLKAKLDRLELRQEALILTVGKLVDVTEATRDSVGELLAWARQPSSSDLSDTLAQLAAVVGDMHQAVVALGQHLPGRVADEIAARCR